MKAEVIRASMLEGSLLYVGRGDSGQYAGGQSVYISAEVIRASMLEARLSRTRPSRPRRTGLPLGTLSAARGEGAFTSENTFTKVCPPNTLSLHESVRNKNHQDHQRTRQGTAWHMFNTNLWHDHPPPICCH